jgi:hypothetical protein
VKIILRGDAGFCGEELMKWCADYGVDHVLALAKNDRLKAAVAPHHLARSIEESLGLYRVLLEPHLEGEAVDHIEREGIARAVDSIQIQADAVFRAVYFYFPDITFSISSTRRGSRRVSSSLPSGVIRISSSIRTPSFSSGR